MNTLTPFRAICVGIALLSFGMGHVTTARAQVLPFNDVGITMGHHHLYVADVELQKKIWVEALGGELSGNAPRLFVKFPGVFLILSDSEAREGTDGSAIDHIAFEIRDVAGTRAKLEALGVPISNASDTRFDGLIPGGIEVHFIGNPALATPTAHRSIVFASADPDAERVWWEKVFGAQTMQEGQTAVSLIPGSRVLFIRKDAAQAPSRGRTLDHTGVGVRDVDAFCKRVTALDVTCERLFGGTIAMVTDPAGVTIEINAGLENR